MDSVSWSDIKAFVDNNRLVLKYIECTEYYRIYAFDGPFYVSCTINKTGESANLDDFEDNYKDNSNRKISAVNIDGREIVQNTPRYIVTIQAIYEIYGVMKET
jgi:hypothetical protein